MPSIPNTTYPNKPVKAVKPNPLKKGVITRKLHGVIYDIMIRTVTDQVYDANGKSLTERLYDIMQALAGQAEDIERILAEIAAILEGAPEEFNSFKEIYDYVNIHGDPKSELIQLIESMETKEEAEEMKNMLLDAINDTKEEFEEKYNILSEGLDNAILRIETLENRPNIIVTDSEEVPSDVKVGDIWYRITSYDE